MICYVLVAKLLMGRNIYQFFLKVGGCNSKSGIRLGRDAQIVMVGAEVAL